MKILAVLCQNPWRHRDGGTYAVRASLRELARKGDLYLAGFGEDFHAPCVGPFRSAGSLGEAINSGAAFLRALALGRSYSAEKYASRFAQDSLRRILSRDTFAVVWYEKLQAAAAAFRAGALRPSPVSPLHVLRSHNVEHSVFWDRFEMDRGLKHSLLRREQRLLQAFELEVLKTVSLTFTISSEDRDRILGILPELYGRIHFLPVTPDEEPTLGEAERGTGQSVLFVGDCKWRPNFLAAEWIAVELAPRLHDVHPELRLRMAGRGTEAFHRRVPNLEGLGFVEDLDVEYRSAICTLAPVWHGGGVNIKVVESLAHGVPVVGSVFARRGIVSEAFLQAETVTDFVNQIGGMISDPAKTRLLSQAAQNSMKEIRKYFDEFCGNYVVSASR